MRFFHAIFTIGLLALACDCNRKGAFSIVKVFPGGVRYEKLECLSTEVHILTAEDVSDSASRQIIVPGEILWCDLRGNKIVGEKTPAKRPAKWMDPNWDRRGYFMLNTYATSEEVSFGRVVTWFETKEAFDKALGMLPHR